MNTVILKANNDAAQQEGAVNIYSPLEALFSGYRVDRDGIERISEFVAAKTGLIAHFISGNRSNTRVGTFTAQELFMKDGAIASLNSAYWSRALAMTDVLETLPASKRNEWSEMIYENRAPEFDRETVIATIQSLMHNRNQFFAEKVDTIFRALSDDHVTNAPSGFGKRMIISYMLDRYGYLSTKKCEYIQDLRAVVAKVLERAGPCSKSTFRDLSNIPKESMFGSWISMDGGAVRVKMFKKGTAHLEIHPDVAWRLNKVLAQLYPAAIPSEFRSKPPKQPKDHALQDVLLSPEILEALEKTLESSRYIKEHKLRIPATVLANGADSLEKLLETIGGSRGTALGEIVFPFPPAAICWEILRTGSVPEQVSHQFYPTEERVATEAVALADVAPGETVLEPSAGHGHLARHLPQSQTVCVEISKIHTEILKAQGFDVHCADFLKWTPAHQFDKVVMNPPFSNARALDHLRHAASMVRPGGRIVAILPASLTNKDLLPGFSHQWGKTIENAFTGTGVRVAILVANKDRA